MDSITRQAILSKFDKASNAAELLALVEQLVSQLAPQVPPNTPA